ncbi:MAG: nucleotidyl transferase AbiEii/AbiGii toxin family protein [Clostridiales bacterium]|nr:nucleotidyl transferase AbiEii/AbiGii toxin family protein [Clostridiales bacterium]
MKLHLDRTAFLVLIDNIHKRTGYREDVLEKDYYVTLILKELADKQANGLRAYFKGGTALYKALKTTNRFSEDIDLSVDVRDAVSRTQSDKWLEQATKNYSSLVRDKTAGRTNRSEIISVYEYGPVAAYDADDALQRFGKLRIEATSFTMSEPVESMEIAPMLYDLASNDEKHILESQYKVSPFQIKTISLERAFIDKLFAAEAYTRKTNETHRAFEAAKHIYDLSVMSNLSRIRQFYDNAGQMTHLLNIRMEEESGRLDGIPGVKPQQFIFFDHIEDNQTIRKAYETMQNQYVLRRTDRIAFEKAVSAVKDIHAHLQKSLAWSEYQVPLQLQLKLAQQEADRLNESRLESVRQMNRNDPSL